MQLEQIW